MDEKMELFKDYEECLKRMNEFNVENMKKDELWAKINYIKWCEKSEDFKLNIIPNGEIPTNEIQRAWNALPNFKTLLEKYAITKEWNNKNNF